MRAAAVSNDTATVPGFVDMQVNGYRGIDFSSPTLTEKQFLEACHNIVQDGTAVFLPTVITSSMETYEHVLKLMDNALANSDTGIQRHVLGVGAVPRHAGHSLQRRCRCT